MHDACVFTEMRALVLSRLVHCGGVCLCAALCGSMHVHTDCAKRFMFCGASQNLVLMLVSMLLV
jgi:hypothetical protein